METAIIAENSRKESLETPR